MAQPSVGLFPVQYPAGDVPLRSVVQITSLGPSQRTMLAGRIGPGQPNADGKLPLPSTIPSFLNFVRSSLDSCLTYDPDTLISLRTISERSEDKNTKAKGDGMGMNPTNGK
ncbi:hypothetical protein M231_06616 [Tremella mesenterica]|uniref:Uncharacterized protein n=1 Tax=Tremella mesenterica TaxID=5217 RepID=A0A4Q1BF14_TREME|nr:hypothetical protein M231_06616 [Tremella mesenterica]